MPYHETMRETVADLVGARPGEAVVMNSLTVNLHLMLGSFYRPTAERYRIVIEADVFPSDRYAVMGVARAHGLDPATPSSSSRRTSVTGYSSIVRVARSRWSCSAPSTSAPARCSTSPASPPRRTGRAP